MEDLEIEELCHKLEEIRKLETIISKKEKAEIGDSEVIRYNNLIDSMPPLGYDDLIRSYAYLTKKYKTETEVLKEHIIDELTDKFNWLIEDLEFPEN